jgi:hypothetical protein
MKEWLMAILYAGGLRQPSIDTGFDKRISPMSTAMPGWIDLGVIAVINLDGNSQVCFHKIMLTDRFMKANHARIRAWNAA